jgi:hypothetical protein
MLTHGGFQLMALAGQPPEGAGHHDALTRVAHVTEDDGGMATQLPDDALQHHGEGAANGLGVSLTQLPGGLDPHQCQPLDGAPRYAP